MKKLATFAVIFFSLLSTPTSFAVIYDFESPEALSIHGLTTGNFTVDGFPLEIQAGSMSQDGNFILGGANATLSVIEPTMSIRGGLGVESDIDSGTGDVGLTRREGIIFNFDPLFIPEAISLTNFTLGNGAFEAVRIFVSGSLFGDFPGGADGVSDVTINLAGAISTLGVTPLFGEGLSSDPAFSISSIEGTPVPEPSTIIVIITGLMGLAGWGRKKFKNS